MFILIDIREGSIFSNNRTLTGKCNRNKLSRKAAGNNYFACGQKTKFVEVSERTCIVTAFHLQTTIRFSCSNKNILCLFLG